MRDLKEYRKRPTINRIVLVICLACSAAVLVGTLLADSRAPVEVDMALHGASAVLILVGCYYLVFSRVGIDSDAATERRVLEKLSESGPLGRKVALVNKHDTRARRLFGGVMLVGGLVSLLASVLPSLPLGIKLLFLVGIGIGAFVLLRNLMKIEDQLKSR